jgi:hypothetical protein
MGNAKLINLILQVRNGNESAFFEIYNNFEGLIEWYAKKIR